MMIELRKMRIIMRGIKIGKKKGGGKVTLMDVFEKKTGEDEDEDYFWIKFISTKNEITLTLQILCDNYDI